VRVELSTVFTQFESVLAPPQTRADVF